MTRLLKLTLSAALLLSTLAIAPPPAAAAVCVDPVNDPTGCVPCWDGGNNCPCDIGNGCDVDPCTVRLVCDDPCDRLPCDPCNDTTLCEDPCERVSCQPCDYVNCNEVPNANDLPKNPNVVNHGNASFSVKYTQCDHFGQNCQVRTLVTTPNHVNEGTNAIYSPGVPSQDVYTPGVPEACAPFAIVCVSANPIYVTTVPGVGPVLLVPALGVDAGVTQLGFTVPAPVYTPVGPYTVIENPVSVVVCRDTCAVPTGVTGGPYAQGNVTVSVGSYSQQFPIGLP